MPAAKFDNLPKDVEHSRWIFSGAVPGPIEDERVPSPLGQSPVKIHTSSHGAEADKSSGGEVRIVDSTNFPAASTIAAAIVVVEPGRLRELHWHSNNDEWQYFIRGKARMTVFASGEGEDLRL
ncbi:cupin domain-containing protein [Komagataeibacter rhaeticus]|nr:cupin domain-containing protein [Komagataeibacter rhaeticus]